MAQSTTKSVHGSPDQPGPKHIAARRGSETYGEGYWGDLDYPGSDLESSGQPGVWVERSYVRGYRLGHPNGGPDDGSGWQFAGRGVYGDRVNWGPGPDANVSSSVRFPHQAYAQSQPAPNYRGVGSRHYQRSDERIREDVQDRFLDDVRLDPTDVDVQVQNGVVNLTGHVPTRVMKWRAAKLAEHVAGVKDVQNHLQVA